MFEIQSGYPNPSRNCDFFTAFSWHQIACQKLILCFLLRKHCFSIYIIYIFFILWENILPFDGKSKTHHLIFCPPVRNWTPAMLGASLLLFTVFFPSHIFTGAVKTLHMDQKPLDRDFLFEYSSHSLSGTGEQGRLVRCILTCKKSVGSNKCLAASYDKASEVCSCGFVDFNNHVSSGIAIKVMVSSRCRMAECKLGQKSG